MANTMTGRVLEVRPTQTLNTKTGKQFLKRELVLDCTRFDPYTGEKMFENFPSFSFMQDKCSLLDGLVPGQVVEVSFDVQGRKSSDPGSPDRYFNDVRGYKVEVVRQQASAQQPQAPAVPPVPQQPQANPYPYGAASSAVPPGYIPQPQNPFGGAPDPFNPGGVPY